ncbi:MAG: lipoprotein [Gammaproteobacteria bacterium]
MFRRYNLLVLLAAILASLPGCGLKGDLYLPDEEREPTVVDQLEDELSEKEDVSGRQQQR